MTTLTFDLNDIIKSRYINLKKNSDNEIIFKNDVKGQIKIKEQGSKIILTVYKAIEGVYNYTKFVDNYKKIDENNFELTTKKYEYNKNNGNWEISDISVLKHVDINNIPDDVIDCLDDVGDKQLYCRYIQTFSYGENNLKSSFEKDFLADSITEYDSDYKAEVIIPTGKYSKVLTSTVLAKITIANGVNANSLTFSTDKNENYDNLLVDKVFSPVKYSNTYSGTYLNEKVTQSYKNEYFNLRKGYDEIIYDFNFGLTKAGNDTVKLVKGETVTLNLLNCFDYNGTEITPTFSKSGNSLIIKFTDFSTFDNNKTLATNLGKITVKNYFTIAKDNLFIKYDNDDMTLKSVKDILEYVDGIGFIGNSRATENQTITGSFINQIIYGGRGNDTIKAEAGYNVILAGKGDDKIYAGSNEDNLVFYSGDAFFEDDLHNGDKIYNLTSSDSLNFYDYTNNNWIQEDDLNNLSFEKSENNLIICHDGRDETSRTKDKYVIVNHFKTANNLEMINGVNISQNLINVYQEGKDKIYGSKYNDFITMLGKAVISTGAGNDTLYLRKNTDDTINLTGSGEKKALFVNASDPAKFTKTINFKNADANLKLSFPYENNNERTYIKKGNDLIVGLYNTDFTTENPDYTNNPNEKYIIKNYFSKKDNDNKYSYEDNISILLPPEEQTDISIERNLKDEINKFRLIKIGNKKVSSKYSDTCYNDVIIGGIYKDTYNVINGGDDIIYDIKGNDVYKVANLRNSLEIYDSSGKDTLNITNVNNYGIYFDVTINIENKVSSTGVDFKIFDTTLIEDKEIKNGITIHNFLGNVKDFKATTSKGYIETMNIGVNKISINVNSIANTVANWLSDNGYTSSASVFADEKTEGDIIKMINVYTSGR